MKDFETRKLEYLKRLKRNSAVIEEINFAGDEPELEEIRKEIVFNPKNEEELKMANIVLTITRDFVDLMKRVSEGKYKQIPVEENVSALLYVSIINLLREGKSVDSLLNANRNNSAELLYSFLIGFLGETDKTFDFIADRTGFVFETEKDMKKFLLYMDKAKYLLESYNPNSTIIKFNNEIIGDSIDSAQKLCNDFHKLCREGKISNKGKTLKK